MRAELARKWISGSGLEIGALHFPTEVPPGVQVVYVDHEDVRTRHHDIEIKVTEFIPDDAEKLFNFGDATQDFIISNHVLEHCEDAIGTLKTWVRVLRPGGILYCALPEKTETFDKYRPVTPLNHLIKDHIVGPEHGRWEHFVDWFTNAEMERGKHKGDALAKIVSYHFNNKANIHWHVWDRAAMRELFDAVACWLNMEILEDCLNGAEMIWVLKKLG